MKRHLASDNYSGVHPKVLAAIAEANRGHAAAYGDDETTAKAVELFERELGSGISVHFVFTGTAANVLSLQALLAPWESAVCATSSHLNTDECGAAEKNAGCKLLLVEPVDGKLTWKRVERVLGGGRGVHSTQPKLISISQSTEYGTVYSLDELRALAERAHERGMLLHVDGARIANAAASLGVSLREATRACGVDVFSFGGTKNGMLGGEAVVFFDRAIAERFGFLRKQAMQLASKMRFVSAQFVAMLQDGLWLENARHSNRMARALAEAISALPGIEVTRPVQANAVFARIPAKIADEIRRDIFFYPWNAQHSEVRMMTSFDTTEEDIQCFVRAARTAFENEKGLK